MNRGKRVRLARLQHDRMDRIDLLGRLADECRAIARATLERAEAHEAERAELLAQLNADNALITRQGEHQ